MSYQYNEIYEQDKYTVNYARQCRNTAVIQAKTFDTEKNPLHLINS